MDKHLTTLTLAAIAASLVTLPATAELTTATLIIAQNDPASPPPPASKDGTLQPQRYPETPAEVAECMKTWDQETGMSQAEYEAACKRTLKYYPETPDTPPR